MGLGQWALDVAALVQASRSVISHATAAAGPRQWAAATATSAVWGSQADAIRRDVDEVERRVGWLRGDVERWRAGMLQGRARREENKVEDDKVVVQEKDKVKKVEQTKDDNNDIPQGVDLNLFHTRRAGSLLGSLGRKNGKPATPPGLFTGLQGGSDAAAPEEKVKIIWRDVIPGREEEQQKSSSSSSPQQEVQSRETKSVESIASPASVQPVPTTTPAPTPIREPAPPAAPPPPPPPPMTSSAPRGDPIKTTTPSVQSPIATPHVLRESKVPASRISRLWNYGGLAAGMLGGAISESISRATTFSSSSSSEPQGSVMLSPANLERLVSRLSRMRGAALKLGQMMSFQEAKVLPGPLHDVLQRVQDRADYMPPWQRDRVLAANLGPEWRAVFSEFDETPMAAASIGQVHRATLKSTGRRVAVKIQFPGVAASINSDLDNLAILLSATSLLPKGMYLDKTIANARTELAWECDYVREAECARRFKTLLADDEPDNVFTVPEVHPDASGPQVLTMDFMHGTGVTRIAPELSQHQRDWIGSHILRLCLREITEFRFMQTDPNWSNFLYNRETNKLELLDFGASRAYPEAFARQYVRLLAAAARGDRAALVDLSRDLGYLTGLESKAMVDAHVDSILTLAEPFSASAPRVYSFEGQTVTDRVRALIPVMLRERLTPPPEETYSLHRKVSGAFLLCARLGCRIEAREMFARALEREEEGRRKTTATVAAAVAA